MTTPRKGRSDYWAPGDWNTICYQCGHSRKASTMKRHWQGYYVCPEHWEPRHPQDFVRAVPDTMSPPWTQPMPTDQFVTFCTPNGRTAIPGLAVPGCVIPSLIDPMNTEGF